MPTTILVNRPAYPTTQANTLQQQQQSMQREHDHAWIAQQQAGSRLVSDRPELTGTRINEQQS